MADEKKGQPGQPGQPAEGAQRSLEMRVAELEDKLAKMHVTEEEMKAYQKVSSLMGTGGAQETALTTGCIQSCIQPCIRPCIIRPCIIRNCIIRNCIRVCDCWECINECGGGCLPGGGTMGGGGFGSFGM